MDLLQALLGFQAALGTAAHAVPQAATQGAQGAVSWVALVALLALALAALVVGVRLEVK